MVVLSNIIVTRPDTRLPQSCAGGQGQCWRRSLGHLGRSCKLNRSPKGNTWSAIPVALLCMIVNWSERKQGSGSKGDEAQ